MSEQDDSAHQCMLCRRPMTQPWSIDERCRRRTARHLAYIADRWPLIPLTLAARTVPRYGTPLQVHRLDLAYPPVGGAADTAVHDRYRDQHGTLPAAGRLDAVVRDFAEIRRESLPVPTVPALCAYLAQPQRLAWAFDEHPAVAEWTREIAELFIDTARALDDDRRPTRYRVPCGRCGQQRLEREVGADWVECKACGSLWDEAELPDLARKAFPADTLVTIEQARVITGQSVSTLRRRLRRECIEAADADGKASLYRLGDLMGDVQASERMAA